MTGLPGGHDRAAGSVGARLAAAFRDVYRTVSQPAWLARATAVGLCLASVAFAALLAVGFAIDGQLAVVSEPLPVRLALALPPLVAALTGGTIVGTAMAWRGGYWSRAARVHQTLLAALGVLLVWQLTVLGFLP